MDYLVEVVTFYTAMCGAGVFLGVVYYLLFAWRKS